MYPFILKLLLSVSYILGAGLLSQGQEATPQIVHNCFYMNPSSLWSELVETLDILIQKSLSVVQLNSFPSVIQWTFPASLESVLSVAVNPNLQKILSPLVKFIL